MQRRDPELFLEASWVDERLAAAGATLITLEGGKPLAEARGEVAYAASFFEWFGEDGKRCDGQVIPSHKAGSHILVLREPIGVVATITP
jgi:succinate-semialdehyde dehydrogenase/glutarate-semialdehyde dehydrogenase